MRIIYVTANVLGDSGANAAELFPRFAFFHEEIEAVIVADFKRNKEFILQKQLCTFFRLKHPKTTIGAIKNGVRIARKCKQEKIDIVHIFYRQQNIPLIIFLRLALIAIGAKAKIIVDHRSVNLASGRRKVLKKISNQIMQFFPHQLAGNPLAVETNHYLVWRRTSVIDLGFDKLPDIKIEKPPANSRTSVWFIGSLKPKNRKSEFLIEIFDEIYRRFANSPPFDIRVAGPTTNQQYVMLISNPIVEYYGATTRERLYELLVEFPGIGMAFMNQAHHASAPSIKFAEYAAFGFSVVASDTIGQRTQYERMRYNNVIFAEETVNDWVDKLLQANAMWPDSFEAWETKGEWSYASIFDRQVVSLYKSIL